MFCANCGTENNDGSKFCKKCGSPLIQHSYTEGNIETPNLKRTPDITNIIQVQGLKELLLLGLKDPIGAIDYGSAHGLAKEGMLIILIKDILMALLCGPSGVALLYGIPYVGGVLGSIFDRQSFMAFMVLLILLLATDAITTLVTFGVCKLFKGAGDLNEWLGAAGGMSVLTGTCSAVSLLLMRTPLSPISTLLFGFSTILGIVLMVKMPENVMRLQKNGLIYSLISSAAASLIVLSMFFGIFGATMVNILKLY